MRIFLTLVFVFNLFSSCITVKSTQKINNYTIQQNKKTGEEYFFFRSYSKIAEIKNSLSQQFAISDSENLIGFNRKLFSDIDVDFKLEINVTNDKTKYLQILPLVSEDDIELLEDASEVTYIKISVFDVNGNNALSKTSLFSSKVNFFLIDIKNNIKPIKNLYNLPK